MKKIFLLFVFAMFWTMSFSQTNRIYAIDCGNLKGIDKWADTIGVFRPDTFVVAGDALWEWGNTIKTLGVANAGPTDIYQTVRFSWTGNVTYHITGLTPGNKYLVRLHFSDDAMKSAGLRVFDIKINNSLKAPGFDIVAAANGDTSIAVVKDFANITAIDSSSNPSFSNYAQKGVILLDLVTITDHPAIAAFEVFGTITSIDNKLENQYNINLYPNPLNTGNLTIDLANLKEESTMQVIDITGRVVYKQLVPSMTKTISLNKNIFETGMYIVSFKTAKGNANYKLLVQ